MVEFNKNYLSQPYSELGTSPFCKWSNWIHKLSNLVYSYWVAKLWLQHRLVCVQSVHVILLHLNVEILQGVSIQWKSRRK